MIALIVSSPVQGAEKIYLKWNNFGTEKEFITTTANRSLEVEKSRRDAEDYLAVAWVDLNGDDSRRCWVTEMRHANGLTKPEQLPGYFGFAEEGKNCAK